MRIGLIVPGFSDGEADWCIPALRDLIQTLASQHEVRVFALRYPHRRGTYSVFGARVCAFGGGSVSRGGRLPLMTRALAGILAAGRQAPYDVLHGLWADEPGFLACAAARLLHIPAAVSLLGGELACLPGIGYGGQLNPANRMLTRTSLHLARRVTVGSGYLARLAGPHVDGDRLRILPLGVDTARFQRQLGMDEEKTLTQGQARLLHVASLVPVKGHMVLLRAMSRLTARIPGCSLHLVGSGPLRHALEREVESLGLAGRVIFHGAVPHDRLPHYYRNAALCVQSSLHESQGMAVLEAAACGRLTAGTAVGILEDLLPGRTIPPGDSQALAEAVLDALTDVDWQTQRAAALCQRVEEEYALPVSTARWVELYHSML